MNEGKTFADVARAIRSAQADGVVQMREDFMQWQDGKIHACGLGAAAMGWGVSVEGSWQLTTSFYKTTWPVFTRMVRLPEAGHNLLVGLMDAIVYFNDELEWSLDQIADWLEGLPEPEVVVTETERELAHVV